MTLSNHERVGILIEVIISGGLSIFLYFSAVLLLIEGLGVTMGLAGHPELTVYEYFNWTPERLQLARNLLLLMTFVLGSFVTISRVNKRITALRLDHILDYLKYISKGNYDLRIPETEVGELTDVIASINSLVESTVKAMEEERRIEKTKDELIANVGHDLRTPLTSIVGYLGLIENQKYQSQEELLLYTNIAYEKALSMQNLVNDLFDYAASRLTSYEVNPIEVQINFFFEQLAADFEIMASDKQVEIIVDVKPEDLVVSFDPDKMARVINNLITNALKYGHGASHIILKAYPQDKDTVCLEVRNNGELVHEDEHEKIFQRSYRADQSRNGNVPGTGLGLAIVRNIIEQHEGRVYALIEANEMVFRMEMKANDTSK